MRYYLEKYSPMLIAIVVSGLFYIYYERFKNATKLISDLMNSSLIVNGTLLGFFLTITTILNTIDTRRMRFLKDSGTYNVLIEYLKIAICLNIACLSMIIIIPFLNALGVDSNWSVEFHVFQLLIIFWAWLASIRFAVLFIKLVVVND